MIFPAQMTVQETNEKSNAWHDNNNNNTKLSIRNDNDYNSTSIGRFCDEMLLQAIIGTYHHQFINIGSFWGGRGLEKEREKGVRQETKQ